jgi:hypothetical protein
VLLGPWLGAQLQRRGMTDAMPRVALLGALLLVPACIVLALATSATVVLAAAAFAGVCYSLPQAMAASTCTSALLAKIATPMVSAYSARSIAVSHSAYGVLRVAMGTSQARINLRWGIAGAAAAGAAATAMPEVESVIMEASIEMAQPRAPPARAA